LEGKPDDWLMLSVRGVSYYMLGDLEAAQADYNAAMALQPQANFPYTYAMLIAIREGRIEDVNDLLTIALTEFPDPTLGNRIVEIFSGAGERGNFFGLVVAAFGNLTLGQYNEAIQNVESALAIQADLPELYMMQGLAYCLSGDNAAAESAYSNGIELDPDFTVLYLLRGDVRSRQNDLAGALTDLSAAQATTQWAGFESYVEAAMSGGDSALGCESFFQPEL
jgi:Flp pilus assembly protein TadD